MRTCFRCRREIVTGSRCAVYGRLDPAPLTGDPNDQAVRQFFAATAAHRSRRPPSLVFAVRVRREDGEKDL